MTRPRVGVRRGPSRGVEPGIDGLQLLAVRDAALPPAACSPIRRLSATRSQRACFRGSGTSSPKTSRTMPPSAASRIVTVQAVPVDQRRDVPRVDRRGPRRRRRCEVDRASGCDRSATAAARVATGTGSARSQPALHARMQAAPSGLSERGIHGREIREDRTEPAPVARGGPPGCRARCQRSVRRRELDQYWSALRISPPARVTRVAINWTEATSLRKWTEPSTNRALAPPGWNE